MLISFPSIEPVISAECQHLIKLEPKSVHLWGITLDGSAHCLTQCREWLDKRERDRAGRLVRVEGQERFVFAHGGLRAVLSRYLDVRPDLVGFDRSESGKPILAKELRDPSAITFNLSHAHGRALIAVSQGQEVGVDLEFVRPDIEVAKLSERYFTRSEHTAIMQLPQEQRATRFFRYWVAKEAVLKAQGIGLRGLAGCEIVLGTDDVDTEVQVRLGSHIQNRLRVRLLACEKGWEAAVAAQDVDRVKLCGSYPE